MKLLIKEKFKNLADGKNAEIEEEFLFDNSEISYTLKNGVTFMAKIENKGLSAYIAIVKRVGEMGDYEVVDSFDIALNKSHSYFVDSLDANMNCEFYLIK